MKKGRSKSIKFVCFDLEESANGKVKKVKKTVRFEDQPQERFVLPRSFPKRKRKASGLKSCLRRCESVGEIKNVSQCFVGLGIKVEQDQNFDRSTKCFEFSPFRKIQSAQNHNERQDADPSCLKSCETECAESVHEVSLRNRSAKFERFCLREKRSLSPPSLRSKPRKADDGKESESCQEKDRKKSEGRSRSRSRSSETEKRVKTENPSHTSTRGSGTLVETKSVNQDETSALGPSSSRRLPGVWLDFRDVAYKEGEDGS